MNDEMIEALRRGRTPQGRPDLEALASLFSDLQAAHQAEPVPPMSPELAELVRTGMVGERSSDEATTDSSSLARTRRVKLLIGAAVGSLGLVSGLGAAGALPAPVQRMFASTAEVVGFDVPRPPESPTTPPNGSSDSPAPPPAPTTTTTCPAPKPSPEQSSPEPSSPEPTSGAEQSPPRPRTSPGDGACAATTSSTSTSTTATTRPGSTTTEVDRSTTTTTTTDRRSSTTTARATTSTSAPVDR